MTANSTNVISDTYLAFLKSIIQPPFDDDTNANVDHVWIALIYPTIEIYNGKTSYSIDCNVQGFHAREHSYPLMRFLEQLPEFCEKIISSHPYLQRSYQDFCSIQNEHG